MRYTDTHIYTLRDTLVSTQVVLHAHMHTKYVFFQICKYTHVARTVNTYYHILYSVQLQHLGQVLLLLSCCSQHHLSVTGQTERKGTVNVYHWFGGAFTGGLTFPWEAGMSPSSGYRFNVTVGQRESGLPRCHIPWRFTLRWPQRSSFTSPHPVFTCLCVYSSASAVQTGHCVLFCIKVALWWILWLYSCERWMVFKMLFYKRSIQRPECWKIWSRNSKQSLLTTAALHNNSMKLKVVTFLQIDFQSSEMYLELF